MISRSCPKPIMRGWAQFNTVGNLYSVKALNGATVQDELFFTSRCGEVLHVSMEATGAPVYIASVCAGVAACCKSG